MATLTMGLWLHRYEYRYALLLLTNLLEIHRVLREAGPEGGGGEAPDAAAAEQSERKKQDLLEKIRTLTLESSGKDFPPELSESDM